VSVKSKKQPAVVSLGAGPNQVPLIRKAAEQGFFVIAVDGDTKAPGFKYSDIALGISTYDKDAVIAELVKLLPDYKMQGVLARVTGQALVTASAISRMFSVPGIDETVASISTEKAGIREFLNSHDIPVPVGTKVLPNKHEKRDFHLPVIIKPDFTITGKKDIYLVSNEHSFTRCLTAAMRSSRNGCAEVEQFIEGIDVSCMFFANNGKAEIIAYWDELVAVLRGGIIAGMGLSIPSVTYGTTAEENMKNIVSKFASFFPEVASIMVLSFRVDFQGNPSVIELHADLTGDLILDVLLPVSCKKFDPMTFILEAATGSKTRFPETEFTPVCLYYRGEKNRSHREYGLIQEPSCKENLEKFSGIMVNADQNIDLPPKHLPWLLENTGDKAPS
jgi:hypothetical protein